MSEYIARLRSLLARDGAGKKGRAMTDLDAAQTRADASPPEQADQARLAFFKVLADAPLFVLLERDAQNEVLEPRIFDLDEGPVVLAFDTEDRLAAMGEGPMPYAQLPGRVLARLLSAEGLGLGLNLGSAAPSEMLLPLAAMRWLEQMLDQEPDLLAGDFGDLTAPDAELVAALRAILASAPATWGGLAQTLWVYGRDQSALVIVDGAPPEAQIALATALSEALRFAGFGRACGGHRLCRWPRASAGRCCGELAARCPAKACRNPFDHPGAGNGQGQAAHPPLDGVK